ncbi:hypothetical protein WN55_08132 [Dufourea novaeangliae]|uniref:Uncharacterized protein n=1 Tax=Dufourea novaeangliae TaxID=178035 RepID=A0A154P6S8_DUFNO|nr:hypothetical protein WN55_08132 [Dufourea novaeangliae]
MSDERKVSIGRITSKRSRGEKEGGGAKGEERPDDGLITLHSRDSSLIGENIYEFQIHFPNVRRHGRRCSGFFFSTRYTETDEWETERERKNKREKNNYTTGVSMCMLYVELV